VLRSPDLVAAEAAFNAFVEALVVLPLSVNVARRCAHLRHQLKQEGKRVNARALDLLIAATAMEHQLVLVTRNRDDYTDISGLRLYAHG
jgi:tRNA(fMet)-specific endonuclease VapC